jgi:5-hydroxyisourate hydrolase-like protein (transthyretin family)
VKRDVERNKGDGIDIYLLDGNAGDYFYSKRQWANQFLSVLPVTFRVAVGTISTAR